MKLLTLVIAMCVIVNTSWAVEEKQIKLEDIESDTLIGETGGIGPQQKEVSHQPQQHFRINYAEDPQNIFVTPQPRGGYSSNDSPANLRSQLYHLPKVHEAEQTYTVPAKQTLIQPIIGGGQPIQPVLSPQPQYIYIQSPQAHQSYVPQAQTYFMLPYAPQYTQQQPHVQQHAILQQPQHLSAASPTVFAYAHSPSVAPQQHQHYQQPSYQSLKSIEYTIPTQSLSPIHASPSISPLHTAVDYKNSAPITIVPKKTLPSIQTTSFQQFYSPGLEYHYMEAMPVTKLSPQQSYSYQQAPTYNYHTNHVSQTPSYSYFQSGPSASTSAYNKHQSNGLLESYVPSLVTYARQQQQQQQPQQFKNYYPTQYQQTQYQQQSQYTPSPHVPQQLFTPAQSASSNYSPYPSPQAYNTIQYSVSLPPYDHSKRSTSKATASLNVKAPKSN